MKIRRIVEEEVNARALEVAVELMHDAPQRQRWTLFGVPRGGLVPAYAVARELVRAGKEAEVVGDVCCVDAILDDILDSGKTRERFQAMCPGACFKTLYTARAGEWLVFPWEATLAGSAEDIPRRMLQFVGEDAQRDGLRDTPRRVVASWSELFSGYGANPAEELRTFENEEGYNEMVVLRDIEFYSTCEHHLLPFFGRAHIAYIPSGRIVGISKLARVVEAFSRRLQVQERLTQQIARVLEEELHPKGVAVMLEAQHLCMIARGVQKQNSVMTTSALLGEFERAEVRGEFLSLVKGGQRAH